MKKPKAPLETLVGLEPGERDATSLRQFALDAAVKTSVPGCEAGEVLATAAAFLAFLEASA